MSHIAAGGTLMFSEAAHAADAVEAQFANNGAVIAERAARLREKGVQALRRHLVNAKGRHIQVLMESEGRGRAGDFDCTAMDWFIERARALGVDRQPPAPLLLGRHVLALGVPPGPRVGEILRAVYEQQLDGELTTTEEAIAAASRILSS